MKAIARSTKRTTLCTATLVLLALALAACSSTVATSSGERVSAAQIISATDTASLRERIDIRVPTASGEDVYEADGITLDCSNADDGYVMMKCESDGRFKVRIEKNDVTYTYDLPSDGEYVTFALSEGSGEYELRALEQVEGTSYAVLFTRSINADIDDEFSPFLYPNAHADYDEDTYAVLFSFAACEYANADTPGAREALLYKYVAENVDYDYDKAETVQSGYLPDVDDTLETGKGICFDYSALLACMLRSQAIPTQLITGYVSPEDIYHAWNRVYLDGEWVWRDATFDGSTRRESDYAGDRIY